MAFARLVADFASNPILHKSDAKCFVDIHEIERFDDDPNELGDLPAFFSAMQAGMSNEEACETVNEVIQCFDNWLSARTKQEIRTRDKEIVLKIEGWEITLSRSPLWGLQALASHTTEGYLVAVKPYGDECRFEWDDNVPNHWEDTEKFLTDTVHKMVSFQ